MLFESAENSRLHSWLDALIKDLELYGGCGGDEDCVKINDSCNLADILPADPFEMNLESASADTVGWNCCSHDDYEMVDEDPFQELMEEMRIQVSGGCARDDQDLIKMNSSCDPIHLLPADPFEMNRVPEIDNDEGMNGVIARWVERVSGNCMIYGSESGSTHDPALDSRYYQDMPHLSSIATQAKSAVDFCKAPDFPNSFDLSEGGNFEPYEAMDEASSSGRDFSASFLNATVNESFAPFEDMKEVSVLGKGFSASLVDVTGDESFPACKNIQEMFHTSRVGDVKCLHEGFLLSLSYLGVRDLLYVEMVCRSLRSVVQNNPLLWRHILIDSQLGKKITDDDLYRLTQKAHGNLKCLSLIQCSKITDDCLKRVLDTNPMLQMLKLGGYNSLSSKSSEMPGITRPKYAWHYIGSVKDLEELRLLVGAGEPLLTRARELHFFQDGMPYSFINDNINNISWACLACMSSESQDIRLEKGDDDDMHKVLDAWYQAAI